jgi:hypothetical protein
MGVGYGLYTMVTDSTSMLIVGLVGIIGVLLFAMASGYGRSQQTIIVNQKCDTKPDNGLDWIYNNAKKNKAGCPVSSLKPPGVCPKGYYNYTDGEGNTLCCGSKNIDPYAHTCPALGSAGVCSMAPGTEDTRVTGIKSYYPLCQDITKKQELELSRKTCPPKYPYFLQMPDSDKDFKCCGSKPASGATSCPSDASCDSLKTGEDVFTTPNSCEALKFHSELKCGDRPIFKVGGWIFNAYNPDNMDKFIPYCNDHNALPRGVIEKFKSLGFASNIKDPNKSYILYDNVLMVEKLIRSGVIKESDSFKYMEDNYDMTLPDFYK